VTNVALSPSQGKEDTNFTPTRDVGVAGGKLAMLLAGRKKTSGTDGARELGKAEVCRKRS